MKIHLLLDNLARAAGGRAKDEDATFESAEDSDYQALLNAIRQGRDTLHAKPRMDMPGAVAIPQKRIFDKVF